MGNRIMSVNCLDSPVYSRSLYSCILIHVSAFSEAAPWLLNRSMAFNALTRRSLLKPRQEEALMHFYNGVCCMLAALPFWSKGARPFAYLEWSGERRIP